MYIYIIILYWNYIGIILELWGFEDLWLLYTCLTSKYHALIEPWWQTIFPTSAEDRPFTWMCIFCCISFSTLQRRQEGKVSLDEVSGAFSSAQKHPAELRTVDIMIHDSLRISEMCQPLWLLSPCQSGQSALAPASVVQNSPQRNGLAVLPTIVIIHDRSSLNILTVNWWSMKKNKLCLCCTLQWTSMVNGSCTLVDCIFYCLGPHFGSSAGCETCCRGRWLAISDQCSFSDATRTKETWKKGWLSGYESNIVKCTVLADFGSHLACLAPFCLAPFLALSNSFCSSAMLCLLSFSRLWLGSRSSLCRFGCHDRHSIGLGLSRLSRHVCHICLWVLCAVRFGDTLCLGCGLTCHAKTMARS